MERLAQERGPDGEGPTRAGSLWGGSQESGDLMRRLWGTFGSGQTLEVGNVWKWGNVGSGERLKVGEG